MGSLASFSQHLSDAVNLAAAANGVFPVSSISVLAGDVLLNAGTAGGYVAFNLFDSCDEKPAKKVLNPSFEALLNPALQKPVVNPALQKPFSGQGLLQETLLPVFSESNRGLKSSASVSIDSIVHSK